MALRKYTYVDFTSQPPTLQVLKPTAATINAVDTGVAATAPGYMWVNGNYFEWQGVGDRTNIAFVPAATGWKLPLDGTDAEGIEITQGVVSGVGQNHFTVGTDAFKLRAVFKITTLANIDHLQAGFRLRAAYGASCAEVADIGTAYTDFAVMGISDSSGTLRAATELNNGGLTATALAHAVHVAGELLALEVNVAASRAVTYRVGTGTTKALALAALAADANTVAFNFDNADVVLPVIVCGATVAGAPDVELVEYLCGVV